MNNNPKAREARDEQNWETVAARVRDKAIRNKGFMLEKSGDWAYVVFRGEPFAHEAAWEGSNGWVVWNPDNPLHKIIEPSLRIRINVAVIDGRSVKVDFWEMGVSEFKTVNGFRENLGSKFCDSVFRIEKLDDDDAEPYFDISLRNYVMDTELKSEVNARPMICLETTYYLETRAKVKEP